MTVFSKKKEMKRSRITYLVLFLSSLYFIYFYGGLVPYSMFFIVLFLPVLSFAYTGLVYLTFKFQEDIDKRFVVKGDVIEYSLTVGNESIIMYPYIEVNMYTITHLFNGELENKPLSLGPFESRKIKLPLQCKYRGRYSIGISSIIFTDLLNLMSFEYKPDGMKRITVHPNIVKDYDEVLLNRTASETKKSSRFRQLGMDEIFDIREYSYGDTLKKIHWNLSSKFNKFMIRETRTYTEKSMIVLLDIHKNPYDLESNTIVEDKIVEAAVSVIYQMLSHNIPVRLVYYREGIQELYADNLNGFERIYSLLAEIEFNQEAHLEDVLGDYMPSLMDTRSIRVFTADLTSKLTRKLCIFDMNGFDTGVYYIPFRLGEGGREDISGEIREYFVEHNIRAVPLDVKKAEELMSDNKKAS